MFVETWRKHWGLTQDPFACEDADKDLILGRMDSEAVHSGFDRLFGDPTAPAPGIVFGEKGSGKSGLRLTMARRLEEHNRQHSSGRVFCSEYNDFDGYLEQFRRSIKAKGDPATVAQKIMLEWTVADHIDAMLSLGVSHLVDGLLDGSEQEEKNLTPKQRADLLVLTGLYHQSPERSTKEALGEVGRRYGFGVWRRRGLRVLSVLLSLAAVALVVTPFVEGGEGEDSLLLWPFLLGAVVLLGVAWIPPLLTWLKTQRMAHAADDVRILDRNDVPLACVLAGIPSHLREELALPRGADEGTRFEFLTRFLGLLACFGYGSWYVLFDRVDEPSLLNTQGDSARRFVERILDHKLLQLPGLGLKLFLPIELDGIWRNASPDELKRMRLEKSNLVENLDWTGQELLEIASFRMRACQETDARAQRLEDFFAEDFDHAWLRASLQELATPRYALGFLQALLREYTRNLEDGLADDSDRWLIPRSHFDLLRAEWLNKVNLLRRQLNT